MNPENPSRPEIEAKLTALLLGELPEEEARLLRWTIEQDPGLKKLHDRLATTIGLVREVQAKPTETAPLKLSDERRKKLFAHFKTPRQAETPLIPQLRIPRLITVLAVTAMVALLGAMLLPALSKAKNKSQRASAASKERMLALQKEIEEQDRLAPTEMPPEPNGAATNGGGDSQSVVGQVDAISSNERSLTVLAGHAPAAETPAPTFEPASGSMGQAPTLKDVDVAIDQPKPNGIEAQTGLPEMDRASTLSANTPAPETTPYAGLPPGNSNIVLPQIASGQGGNAETTFSSAGGVVGVVNAFSGRSSSDGGAINPLNQPATSPSADRKTIVFGGGGFGGSGGSGGGSAGGGGGGGGESLGEPPPAPSPEDQNRTSNFAVNGDTFNSSPAAPGSPAPLIDPNTGLPFNTPASQAAAGLPAGGQRLQGVSGAAAGDQAEEAKLIDAERRKELAESDQQAADQMITSGLTTRAPMAQIQHAPKREVEGFETATPPATMPAPTPATPLGQFPGGSATGTVTSEAFAVDDASKDKADEVMRDRFYRNEILSTNGVPYLGDIPVEGNLSTSHSTTFAERLKEIQPQPGQSDVITKDQSKPAVAVRPFRWYLGQYFPATNESQVAASNETGQPKWLDQLTNGMQDNADHNFEARYSFMATPAKKTDAPTLPQKKDANTLTQDGKLLYEMGKLDEAKQKLQQAITLDPNNAGAQYYLTLVNQARIAADAPLAQPVPNAPIPQPEMLVKENSFSTFSMNVSDVSFQLAAASLAKGRLPEAASVRSEEFINAFDYRDPEPSGSQRIAFNAERAQDPFAQNRDYLRFSLKTAATGRQPGRALNLVLLLDDSGSMERADRVAIIQEALRILATQLQPQDTLSIVTFARTAHLWADGVPGGQAGAVLDKVSGLTPEGGTNLEEAMRLAYETARRHYLANGMNRVVLITDGAANLGDVDAKDLKAKVEANRKEGIALDCFGIGWEDYNDDLLEQLSSQGDGRYAFLNTPEDAHNNFATKLAGALQIAAAGVKVQVEFNPQRTIAYRQIGYATHQLTKQQFRDNTVAAGEIAAAEAGNALYTVETDPAGDGPIATVHVRYQIPGTAEYREQSWDVPYTGHATALDHASPAMRLAATSAAFSEWLANSPYAGEVTPDQLLNDLNGVPAVYSPDDRPKQLEWMIRQAKSLSGK